MNKTLNKQEIIDWIDFLYKDLLTHRIFIGGYFFTFDQIDNIKCKINTLDDKITRLNNKINMTNHLRGISTLKSLTNASNLMEVETKKQLDFITDEVVGINDYGEQIKLPVTYDELKYVYKRLTYCRDEVEFFMDFLLEEIQNVKDEDLNNFFIFINDFLAEIKENLKEEKAMIKVVVNKNPSLKEQKPTKKSV